MKKIILIVAVIGLAGGLAVADKERPRPALNGIELPADFADWRFISVSARGDNNTMRAVLGNAEAVKAAREGRVNPWPDGAVLAKVVWKRTALQEWQSAGVPGDFVHVEFMIKDSIKYAQTGGWGFARWLGNDLKPYGEDAGFVKECFGCHQPVKKRDYVYTHPAVLPKALGI